jgi:hypothetical protein
MPAGLSYTVKDSNNHPSTRGKNMADKKTAFAQDLVGIDDDIVFCRARGFLGGHKWPELANRPNGRLPRGFRPVLQRDGTVLMNETCARCSKVRWWVTGQGGAWDRGAKRHYTNPSNWEVIPAHLGYTSRDFDAEAYRRLQESIMAAARKAQLQGATDGK